MFLDRLFKVEREPGLDDERLDFTLPAGGVERQFLVGIVQREVDFRVVELRRGLRLQRAGVHLQLPRGIQQRAAADEVRSDRAADR